jgi:gamma-glutamylcyclotransferase (GGCT)/AIG2-like uncharacterized protein YtfP
VISKGRSHKHEKFSVEDRLAVYGTLAPGRINHHQLDGLTGTWTRGTVRRRLVQQGWGPKLGYPGLVLDPSGVDIDVEVFTSVDLQRHWIRLDAFEGAEYSRVVAQILTGTGILSASIYVINL